MDNQYAIEVHKLNKSFDGRHVVRDVSMQVSYGEIFGFLGPNGSGKTTTIRMMCGLLTPDSGTGTCLGYDIINNSEEIKVHVGYMTQRFSMWEDLTIRENFNFIACMYNLNNRKERINKALHMLGLEKNASQLVGNLSGGWKQRMALAACMLHEPKLLLLDEPTAGVDPQARRDFWEELYKLADKGISVLVSTHYMDEAERCHKLAYIFGGKLMAQGTPKEVVEREKIATYVIRDGNLMKFSEVLKGLPGVDQTLHFGNTLHVSGVHAELLKKTLQELKQNWKFDMEPIDTSLEDVFVHLMEANSRQSE